MLVIAHRGANREATENTRKAFDLAIKSGCDRIELDLQITADDRVVIFHDHVFFGLDITQTKLETLMQKSAAINTELLTLDELLAEYGEQTELNLEIKPQHSLIPEIIKEQLHLHKTKKIIISSFYPEPLIACKTLMPKVPMAVLWEPESVQKSSTHGLSLIHI